MTVPRSSSPSSGRPPNWPAPRAPRRSWSACRCPSVSRPEMVTGPLEGIRVIDLTIWMSGAIASMLLGDLGADVIKIEGPTGDPVRRYVPIGLTESAATPAGVNYAYALCNRNKRQISLDLRDPAGRDRLHELVRGADVFVTSMQAQTLLGLGADEEPLNAVNPA